MDSRFPNESSKARQIRRRRAIKVMLLASTLFLAPDTARAESKEYQVKAVFLFNFAQFIRWPASAFADESSPLTIGILGDDPFGGALEKVTRGETVGGRKLVVKRYRNAGDLRNCQFVFISSSEAARLGEILAALQGTSVLTVGENDRFCSLGGIINFTLERGTVGFEINSAAARRSGLEISSKLLKLAKSANAQ